MCGKKFQIDGVYIPRKCIDSKNFYSFLITPWAEGNYPFPRHCCFENLFLPAAGRGGGNFDMLYQNSTKKYEDDSFNIFIYYVICSFSNVMTL